MAFKRVCVIGAGPSGLASIRALNGEPFEFGIDVYDPRSNVGGIWNYSSSKEKYNDTNDLEANKVYNFSPIYDNLETNLPARCMQFTDFPFPEGSKFLFRTSVIDYLQKYAKTIGPFNLHLNTKVVSVEKTNDWAVTSENVTTGNLSTKHYDAIVVANGHFEKPIYPSVKGLEEWQQKDPKSVIHAKFYNSAKKYADKTVLVVGGSSSGCDIAVQVSSTAKKVYVSCDEESILNKIRHPYLEIIPRIDEYNVNHHAATFEDKTIKIDQIIFCTGYFYDVPFLKIPLCESRYIKNLYKHIFYVEDPSLVFVGLGKDVSPFPMAEAQSSVLARYFSGRLQLPTSDAMRQESSQELALKGARLHGLKPPKEPEYVNELHHLIEEQHLEGGFMFEKYEGEKLEARTAAAGLKLQRLTAYCEEIVRDKTKRILSLHGAGKV
ncbi:monooxygenase [Yamadazyma tenuis]|nr:monooxygenase [Yamadazyma tenuis]